MKSFLLALCLMMINGTCFATANFTSSNGVFLVPDVSVDGTTNYESVTLQLNLADGTFTVLDATLKDTSFSETEIDTKTANSLKIDFFGCARSGHNQVKCKTKVVSSSSDQTVRAYGDFREQNSRFSPAFDDSSREYRANVAVFDTTNSEFVDFTLIQGVPVEVNFIYNDIDISATSFSAFKPRYHSGGTDQFVSGDFRNIDF